jgi:hypothetical protein
MTTRKPHIVIRAGHPDFLDLPWEVSLTEWEHARRLDLPKGISRHEVRFYAYDEGIYAIKELPLRAARHEYQALRELEDMDAPAVRPVGMVEREWLDPHDEASGAVITAYLDHAFSYRELLSGWGFGDRRSQMLDAFAGLLVELHLLGVYWGDCSLSNVLYRYDAGTIRVTMVDAETARIVPSLSDGQREDDIGLMIENVAGGMADIAAEQGVDIDAADLALGEDIAERYRGLWDEITRPLVVGADERYRITEAIRRLNDLGFEVEDVDLVPADGGDTMRMRLTVGGRTYHSRRLFELTGLEATEGQARQILSDLSHHVGRGAEGNRALAAARWRIETFEPLMQRIGSLEGRHASDPLQAYADYLHHRFVLSAARGRDVADDEAFEDWLAAGQPGYPISD